MCTETDEFYYAGLLIPPNLKSIAFYMALHIAPIIT